MTTSAIESCCHNFSIRGRNKTVIIAVHQSITLFYPQGLPSATFKLLSLLIFARKLIQWKMKIAVNMYFAERLSSRHVGIKKLT